MFCHPTPRKVQLYLLALQGQFPIWACWGLLEHCYTSDRSGSHSRSSFIHSCCQVYRLIWACWWLTGHLYTSDWSGSHHGSFSAQQQAPPMGSWIGDTILQLFLVVTASCIRLPYIQDHIVHCIVLQMYSCMHIFWTMSTIPLSHSSRHILAHVCFGLHPLLHFLTDIDFEPHPLSHCLTAADICLHIYILDHIH